MTEKEEKYKRKNKLFGVWLPHDLYKWFDNYLKVKSVGSSSGERFRNFLKKLQKQSPSVPIFRPKVTLGKFICIRDFPREATEEAQRKRCETCRTHFSTEYKACRDIRRQQAQGKDVFSAETII